jgi:hypothetical protein
MWGLFFDAPVTFYKFIEVLWIRGGVNADPDPAFFISVRIRIQEAKPMRIRILAPLFRHKKLHSYLKNICR